MPEPAARLSADPRAVGTPRRDRATPTRDRDSRHRGDLRPVGGWDRDGDRGDAPSAMRRTVVIRGQVADRYSPRGRPSRSTGGSHRRMAMRPERAALWAVLLGFALVLAALLSAHM